MQYKIVEFDDGLAIIPTNWIDADGKTCKWPPYKSWNRLNKSTEKWETPTTEWDTWTIKKMFASAKNFVDANEKLALAEKQSDVEAITQDPILYKRTRKNRARIELTSSDSEEDPTLKNIKQKNDSQGIEVPTLGVPNESQAAVEPVSDVESEALSNTTTSASAVTFGRNWESMKQMLPTGNESNSETGTGGLIIAHLMELISITNKSLLILQNIENSVKKKNAKRNQYNVDWSTLLQRQIEMLRAIGGRDDRSKINNIMDTLFTDTLGSSFSWKGQKGENSLEKLKLGKVLFDAIMDCKCLFTEVEVKTQLGSWLSWRKAKLERQASKKPAGSEEKMTTKPM